MISTLHAFATSWPWDPWLVFGLAVAGVVYGRGWRKLRRRDPERWTPPRLYAYLAGLAAIFFALASPIEPFSFLFLQVHMLQHLLLVMLAPPLVWLGWPMLPILQGLPRSVRRAWVIPLIRNRAVRSGFRIATHPAVAVGLFVSATWIWHVPALYDLAVRSDGWHYLQHVSFLGSALLFWHAVILPFPFRPRWSAWWRIAILLIADVQNTLLSALLTFSPRVLYEHYESAPRPGLTTALDDQSAAGVLMWVPGSIAFLVPLFVIGLRLLFGDVPKPAPVRRRIPLPLAADSPSDLLAVPVLGRLLRWRHARLVFQIPLLLLAIVVMVDGFTGPQIGAMNLAGVLPWIHWRGLVVFGLLIAGNLFCMACPFTLPRSLARRWRPATGVWPRRLRSKWLAVGLIVLFLWAYEAYDLWDRPAATAGIIVAYFLAAFLVDTLFQGAAFCKYVCPIGQFHFVQSLVSPFEIQIRDPKVCERCETKDCIRGRDGVPGCELKLFVPRKSSNLDCTLCLDCVHACPHDNIGLRAVVPGATLIHDHRGSGIGRPWRRLDVAALIAVLVFGAFLNAALMTAPVVAFEDRWLTGLSSPARTAILTGLGLVVAPIVVMGLAAAISRSWGRISLDARRTAARFIPSLVPIGFAMWLTHYSFHFLTSYATVLPTTQRFLGDHGWTSFGVPRWACSCCLPASIGLLRFEILCLDIGLLASLYVAFRIAETTSPRSWRTVLPWAAVILALFAVGIWIVLQPMEMRGTMG